MEKDQNGYKIKIKNNNLDVIFAFLFLFLVISWLIGKKSGWVRTTVCTRTWTPNIRWYLFHFPCLPQDRNEIQLVTIYENFVIRIETL